ncbi:MAG TPA: DUF4157 domain-containing protein [Polyangiaceae bacterium]
MLALQRHVGNRALLQDVTGGAPVTLSPTTTRIQAKCQSCEGSDRFEQEADRVAEAVTSVEEPSDVVDVSEATGALQVQRACANCEEQEPEDDDGEPEPLVDAAEPTTTHAEPTDPPPNQPMGPPDTGMGVHGPAAAEPPQAASPPDVASAPEVASAGVQAPVAHDVEVPAAAEAHAPRTPLIVEDTALDVGPGQLKKSEYLAEIRAAVRAAAEEVLAPVGLSTRNCPYLEALFGFLARRSARYIDRTLRDFAPRDSRFETARDYAPLITERVRASTETWVQTGQITGLPPSLPVSLVGAMLGAGREGERRVLFKGRSGGAKRANNPVAVQAQLGAGVAPDASVSARMGKAMGQDFSGVRIHNDSKAADLARGHNAKAFTVGRHVAFGAGEYRPGTPVGDALIAHELAHVVQQGASEPTASSQVASATAQAALEAEADESAAGALASLYAGEQQPARVPRRNLGLKLQRCETTTAARAQAPATTAPAARAPGVAPCPTGVQLGAVSDQRGHESLSSSDKDQFRTQLGIMSRMDLTPGPDHRGHCMKEALRTVSNTCPESVYNRGGRSVEPCSGDRCLDIDRYVHSHGSMWGLVDGPTSFLDMHRTRTAASVLEGSGTDACSVVCEQTYSCDRTQPTTGTFRITRNYRAGTHRRADGQTVHITTGTVTKT